jgi:hypothetical protein
MAGDVAAQGITGSGTGSLANWANNAAPSAATLSNTAAGYTTLGGQFLFNAVAGAETDYALFGFLVPALTATNKGNTLIVRGITISTYSTGAAVGSDTILQWGVGFGSSAVSLATADALTGTKAPRRIPVGIQKFAAATTNSVAENIFVKFSQPFPVNPSEYFHVILKMPLGAATASLTFRGTVTIDGTWV